MVYQTFESPKLIADAMLGALARWLRILDLDVVYNAALDDPEIERAVAEDRVILTATDAWSSAGWRAVIS